MVSYRTAFISHAHANNARCARIAALLTAKEIDLWIDLTNLQKGYALTTEITRELRRRQTFVLMVTPTSDASSWVSQELDNYIAYGHDPAMRRVNDQRRLILPVLLEPTTIRPEAEESNWAKVFGLFYIDGVGKSDAQVADEIADALAITLERHNRASPPTDQPRAQAPSSTVAAAPVARLRPAAAPATTSQLPSAPRPALSHPTPTTTLFPSRDTDYHEENPFATPIGAAIGLLVGSAIGWFVAGPHLSAGFLGSVGGAQGSAEVTLIIGGGIGMVLGSIIGGIATGSIGKIVYTILWACFLGIVGDIVGAVLGCAIGGDLTSVYVSAAGVIIGALLGIIVATPFGEYLGI